MTTNTSEFAVSLSLSIGQITLQSESIREFYFIEDIFSFCVTGKIKFYDKHGIFEFGPLTGNEKINIIYGESDNIEWSFNIYKMSKIQSDTSAELGSKQTIELFFVDNMFYNLNFLNFSKSWKNTKISQIITDIGKNVLGVTKWDKQEISNEKLEYFYTPYWNANTTINWLLKRSSGTESGNTGYCFYNNSTGTNLVTLDTLLNNDKLLKIHNEDDGLYVFEDTNTFLFNKILSWKINSIDSTALKKINGETLLGYDNSKKIFKKYENKYTDLLKKHTILGRYSLFNIAGEKRKGFHYDGENDPQMIKNKYESEWIKLYDNQQKINIIIRGHENRKIGELIEIKWPSAEKFENHFNINLSGYYLIKSITHYFSGYNTPSYLQKITLIKNGYEDSNATELKKSTQKNIAK